MEECLKNIETCFLKNTMGSKTSKISDDVVIDNKKGAVHISGRNGHGYTNVRSVFTEYWSNGTKKSENVVDINSEYDSKSPRYVNDVCVDQQSDSEVPKMYFSDRCPCGSNMKRTNKGDTHSSRNDPVDRRDSVSDPGTGTKIHESEHFTGQIAKCQYIALHMCKLKRATRIKDKYNACLPSEKLEREYETKTEKVTTVTKRECFLDREHATILKSNQSKQLSCVFEKLAKFVTNYNVNNNTLGRREKRYVEDVNNNSLETLEEQYVEDGNINLLHELDEKHIAADNFNSLETLEEQHIEDDNINLLHELDEKNIADDNINSLKTLEEQHIENDNSNSLEALEEQHVEDGKINSTEALEEKHVAGECSSRLGVTVPESCQYEIPYIKKTKIEETSKSNADTKDGIYKTTKENASSEHKEVSFESDPGYHSLVSIRSEIIAGPSVDKSRVLELKLQSILKELNVDSGKYIEKPGPIIIFPGLNGYFDLSRSGLPMTEQERMVFEWLRLITFSSYGGNGRPVYLARSGFYHTERNETRCFCCDTTYSAWDATDDVDLTHRMLWPTCPFIVGGITSAGNVPVDECVEESLGEDDVASPSGMQTISLRNSYSERRGRMPRRRITPVPNQEQQTREGHSVRNGGEMIVGASDRGHAMGMHTDPERNVATSNRNALGDESPNPALGTTVVSNLERRGTATYMYFEHRSSVYTNRGSGGILEEQNRNSVHESSMESHEMHAHMVRLITRGSEGAYSTSTNPDNGTNIDDDYAAVGFDRSLGGTSMRADERNSHFPREVCL